jgi:hypothetical protein
MLSSVEATLVGGWLPLFSQYRTDRGWQPAARARSACVSPASTRAARIWHPETMLLITRIYIRFWKRRHRRRHQEREPRTDISQVKLHLHGLRDAPAGVCINCAERIAALILESGLQELAVEPCSGACREAIELYFSTPPERWRGQRAF